VAIFEPLTPGERARLRRTVDAAAFERFLAAAPDVPRRAAVAHFSREVTPEDVVGFVRDLVAAGAMDAAEAAAFERSLQEEEQRGPAKRTMARRAKPGALAFEPIPHRQFLLQLEAPAEPSLRVLWDAIEPLPWRDRPPHGAG
jgi:hypothetical protein